MPLKQCTVDGVNGWKWGDEGKCYTGEGAKEKAMKQGRAVEASKHVQASQPCHDVIYVGQEDAAPWSLANKDENVYIKEAIYEGDFQLPGEIPLSVDEEMVDHWVGVTQEMLDNGIKIPLPLGHTTDPEKNRGEILGAYKGTNQRGEKALFLKAKFADEKAAEMAKTSQVSIFSPPEFIDGKGNRYVRPITHVALTDYPVIPGLQGFQSIAASFVSTQREAIMPLKELAKRLNIQCDNDEQLEDTIVASFASLGENHKKEVEAKDAEIAKLKASQKEDPVKVSAFQLSMLKDNREGKLSGLVGEKISPAVKDALVEVFCSEENLTLSLSKEDGDDGMFNKIIEALRKNDVVTLGPTTEVISLSKDEMGDPEKNPLLADAKRRAEAAKK